MTEDPAPTRGKGFALEPHQLAAINKLRNGKVLVGGTGSGKSITALAYYNRIMPYTKIYILTTAKKRDKGEWFADAMLMSSRSDIEVESWNNIAKFEDVENACFIFDEQRLVGGGAWVKSFYKIAAKNHWILLTATPADVWMDLVPVFVANGFYRNKTEFNELHVRWSRFAKYPKVDGYMDVRTLQEHRDAIYVEMPHVKTAVREEHIVDVEFNRFEELKLHKDRWNFYDELPVKDAGELMRLLRKSTNADPSRLDYIVKLSEREPRLIVFYNHNDPDLELLRTLCTRVDIPIAEYNGHIHQDIPFGDRWIYLVQYQAGAEGWNCTTTNQVVFYSLPYSYRMFEQAKGRIDRLNTPYETLEYHILKSRSIIDQAIWKALYRKKNFQASAFAKKSWAEKPVRTALN